MTFNPPTSEAIAKLGLVIEEMKKSYKNYGLYVYVPVIEGRFSNDLEKLGFKFYESNAELKTLTYLYANGRNIPETNYA